MPWLEGRDIAVQLEGATPHTRRGTPEVPNSVGAAGRRNLQWVTQPAQPPEDLNINDLGGFASLKIRVGREGFGKIEEMVDGDIVGSSTTMSRKR